MGDPLDIIRKSTAEYYTGKLEKFGATPLGVDWNSVEGQELRFRELSQVFETDENFSVFDFGCGYGAYLEYLKKHFVNFEYAGFDLSESMIAAAKTKYGSNANQHWYSLLPNDTQSDYAIASGIFNVKMNHDLSSWESYIKSTLNELSAVSKKGFAFNCLTSYSDADKMRPDLYYASPTEWFDYCKRNYSQRVALFHDYPLYEFTIVVRKQI